MARIGVNLQMLILSETNKHSRKVHNAEICISSLLSDQSQKRKIRYALIFLKYTNDKD